MINHNLNKQESKTSNPKSILYLLINESKKFEEKGGISNICKSVDSCLKPNESLTFIDSYRRVIRKNIWNYEDEVETDYEDFLQRWETTHLFYINSAIRFYEYLFEENDDCLSMTHGLAIASETFRGREGKRSKIGLDNIFDNYLVKLTNIVKEIVATKDVDDIVGLFASSMEAPFVSAEYELFSDFYNLSKQIKEPIIYENISELDNQTHGLCSKILREYCKYSLNDFSKKYSILKLSDEEMQKKMDFKESLEKERGIVKRQVYNTLIKNSGRTARDFILILDRINDLNYLNSNMEVKYSFKGWPGLFHHLIFEKGSETSYDADIHRRQSNIGFKEMRALKWNQYKK